MSTQLPPLKRILMIDDEPTRAMPFVRLGYQVQIAHGYAQVAWYLTDLPQWDPTQAAQLVLLDHDMPAMNGMSVINQFSERLQEYPVWIHSWNAEGARQMHIRLKEDGHRAVRRQKFKPSTEATAAMLDSLWRRWWQDGLQAET